MHLMLANTSNPDPSSSGNFASTQHLPKAHLPTPALRSLDRLGFTRLVEHHLNLARRHSSRAAVILIALGNNADDAKTASPDFVPLAQALRNRLRSLLRRSDTLTLIEGRALGVVLSDVQAEGANLVQRRLAQAVCWAPELIEAGRPLLRIGLAEDDGSSGSLVAASELVWDAEQSLTAWLQ
jgi:GGDEF domain-containing protein